MATPLSPSRVSLTDPANSKSNLGARVVLDELRRRATMPWTTRKRRHWGPRLRALVAVLIAAVFLTLIFRPSPAALGLSSTPPLTTGNDRTDSPNFDFEQIEGRPLRENSFDDVDADADEDENGDHEHNLVVEQEVDAALALGEVRPQRDVSLDGLLRDSEENELDPFEPSHYDHAGQGHEPDELDEFDDVFSDDSPPPFLPYSCHDRQYPSSTPLSPPLKSEYVDNPESIYDNSILQRSVLFAGTGHEIRRVLARATKSSLYRMKRRREGTGKLGQKLEGEDVFKILVLGGSVTNCRGVDPKKDCWPSHLVRWFNASLPMEGKPKEKKKKKKKSVAKRALDDSTILSPALDPRSPPRLELIRHPSSSFSSAPTSSPASNSTTPPSPPPHRKRASIPARPTKSTSYRRKPTPKKMKSVLKGIRKPGATRQRPYVRLIDGSKSATGSAFWAFCYDQELKYRKKSQSLGMGPDLVILEFGINDVGYLDQGTVKTAMKDFERLLRNLRSLPSSPAVVILEAPSLLLAKTGLNSGPELIHLLPAQYYDIPIISAKQAILGPQGGLLPSSGLQTQDLFLPDLHHPNERGHRLMADLVVAYLEEQLCQVQKTVLERATMRIVQAKTTLERELRDGQGESIEENVEVVVEPEWDVPKKGPSEGVLALPDRPLFEPFTTESSSLELGGTSRPSSRFGKFVVPPSECHVLGIDQPDLKPFENVGWERIMWSRDKQYFIGRTPGSRISYHITVGSGGQILLDYLHSRNYDLGNVRVELDGDATSAVVLAGYWDSGFSIGSPEVVFDKVERGTHTLSIEVLKGTESSHPTGKTEFRLIAIVTT